MPVPKRIGQIQFGLLSPREIREMSVRKIIWADTYDDDGFPYPQGLMDLNLGVIDPGLRCKTCDQKASECPGHFGHIELAKPVIHIGYIRLIRKLLHVTCRSCGRVLLCPDEIEKIVGTEDDQIGDFLYEEDVMKERICPHCGDQQLKINFEIPITFSEVRIEDGKKVEHKLNPADIRVRMEKIPDEDLIPLGINPEAARPEWMILTVLPVPPVTMRPSIILDNGQRSEDDLTHKLVDIIRINQRFKENDDAGAPQLIIEDLWELLQYHVTTYINNEVFGWLPACHRSGRPLKTLSQRLTGKDGRFRGSLNGKRVNFSARTVISPDPNLSISQVGIPRAIANELTIPVHVTDYNIEELKKIVLNGPIRWNINAPCGANYVIRPDKRRLVLWPGNLDTIAGMIEPGYTVERHLRDGDIVLFNRQPSLHRMSIMAHRVKVMDGKTFRLNPAVCPPYNADFDGDEMNLHVPQTEEARAEALILMSVQENLLSPRFGGPIIGGVQDHISGIFMLTHDTRWFTKNDALYLLRYSRIERMPAPGKIENGIEFWSNKQVFSIILPLNINMVFRASSCQNCDTCKKEMCESDAYVCISDGILVSGSIDNAAVGAFEGQIISRIIRQEGMSRATDFIDDMTKLSIRAIMLDGFSFGIDDEDLSKTEYDKIDEVMKDAALDVDRRIKIYEDGQLEPMPGRTVEESLETQIVQVLGKARDLTGQISGRHLGLGNSGVIMAVSGACGSTLNLTQMAGCLGQQSIRGERIVRGYYDRTLPHFKKGDRGPDAHGFIQHSYKRGLNPTEFFFHAMGGRDALVDTAVRTSMSGYLQRRLIYAMQDLKVAYDGTVRTSRGRIVQFQYGEDGTDPTKSAFGDAVDVKGIIESVLKEDVYHNTEFLQTSSKNTQDRAGYIDKDSENFYRFSNYSEDIPFNKPIAVTANIINPNYTAMWHRREIILNTRKIQAEKEALTLYNSGVELEQQGRYMEAFVAYDRATNIKPDYDDALKSREKLLQFQNQQNAALYFIEGVEFFENQQYSDAIAFFDKAIEIKPDYADAWINRGVALDKLDKDTEAVYSFDRAIAIEPDNVKAQKNREIALQHTAEKSFDEGIGFFKLERYSEALASIDKAITVNSNDPEVWIVRGLVLGKLEQYSEAFVSFERAIAINPDFPYAWFYRGLFLSVLERFDEAVDSFEKAIFIDPDFAEAWNNRGFALSNLKRHTEALASHDKAMNLEPDNVIFFNSWKNEIEKQT